MRGSFIITGGNKLLRDTNVLKMIEDSLKTKNKEIIVESLSKLSKYPDIKIVDLEEEKKSIGISQTKEVIRFLQEKPFYYDQKVVIVQNADKMTTEAQNSLLKLLEEPPSTALIILNTKTQNDLLPTVLSRCKRIIIDSKLNELNTKAQLIDILKMPIGERLVYAEEIGSKEKDEVIAFLQEILEDQRELLNKSKSIGFAQNANLISDFIQDLENTNVSAKFGLEKLFIELSDE